MLCVAAGGAASAGAAAWWRPSPSAAAHSGLRRFARSGCALGSQVSITVLHADARVAEAALADAFAALETVERVMSIYRPDSELARLNRDGVLHHAHPWLVEVLHEAGEMSHASDGAFDITVQPLWHLFAEAQSEGKMPSDDEITAARRCIGWRRVQCEGRSVSLAGEGMAITLNGIAQGFATDQACAALQRHGIEHSLINAGEISALGERENGQPWRVGIQHPRVASAFIARAMLAGRALATSGDYATSFSSDHRANHIFDPRTGRSPNELASVSIAAESAMQADALSTAVFVLGSEDGLRLVHRTPGADALLVQKDGHTLATESFPCET